MSPSAKQSVTPASAVNLYEAIGLDPHDTTETINEKLHDLKAGWMSKASRSGGQGDKAREQISLIAEAELAFADDDSREEYDLALRRNPVGKTEGAKIDWLTRAWNYYFVRDGGAADVAARYSREQESKNALAFVVSAWIKLLDGKDGEKQAKEFADEAFVLDELSQDTADVHHVRGVVYFLLGDYDRAMKSFDRALAAASDGEKPEILMRKAWVFERQGDHSSAYDLCVTALSFSVPISNFTRSSLVTTLTRAIVAVDEVQDSPERTIAAYKQRRSSISASEIQAGAKSEILANLDVLDKIAAKTKELSDAASAKGADGGKAAVPGISLGIAILNVFLIPVWALGGGIVIIPILFILAFGGWAVSRFVQRSNWTASQSHFAAQQQLAARLRDEIAQLRKKLPAGTEFRASTVKVN